jgi:HD superfamily phosphohydrolase
MVTPGVLHHHLNFLVTVQIMYCQVYIHSTPQVWNFATGACLHSMNMAEEFET